MWDLLFLCKENKSGVLKINTDLTWSLYAYESRMLMELMQEREDCQKELLSTRFVGGCCGWSMWEREMKTQREAIWKRDIKTQRARLSIWELHRGTAREKGDRFGRRNSMRERETIDLGRGAERLRKKGNWFRIFGPTSQEYIDR